jgi:hypothetical protein
MAAIGATGVVYQTLRATAEAVGFHCRREDDICENPVVIQDSSDGSPLRRLPNGNSINVAVSRYAHVCVGPRIRTRKHDAVRYVERSRHGRERAL